MQARDLDSYEGVIIDKGITFTKSKMPAKVFFFRIDGLNQILATYNPSKSYNKLDSALNLGDNVKVYYKHALSTDPNIETFQIEKNGVVILNESSFRSKEFIAAGMALIGGVVILALSFREDKKYWKKETPGAIKKNTLLPDINSVKQ
ncbi:hypothetical protein ACSBL2_05905 [Pedobacter sp. AW31-3R]|uniref:hypothetical protein n=1 Tax=Pedobacter sp. AW31-3R TaxID=3445781 RepID=UPI003FA02F37